MALRDVRIALRDRQTTGGLLPADSQFGEPFINLFDGILRFSGVTGGSYETATQSGVFEVGSVLYNQRISNRLNINNNLIISGDTGIISTYGGLAGASLNGKFLSGTTAGLVLANISDIQGVQVYVQNGRNIITGGTSTLPTINLVDSPSLNNITFSGISTGGNSIATNVSATTFYSGSANLEGIIYNIATSSSGVHTYVQPGTNITTGGTATVPIINLVASPSVNNITFSGTAIGGTMQAGSGTFTSLSATTLSGGTIYSGGTNLYSIFSQTDTITRVQPGTNITTGGTANAPTINLVASPSINSLTISGTTTGVIGNFSTLSATAITDSNLTAGRAVYAGVGGLLKTNSGFTYDDAINTLFSQNLQVGSPSLSGTVTIWGDVVMMGAAISAFTSQLYIEDNNIQLNYNPSASTTSASLGAGLTIQDGSGIAAGDVFLDIRGTATGVANRSFATNLQDIRIRETGTISSPNGSRLLAENDFIDGGTY